MELRVNAEPAAAESPPRFVATPQPLTVMEGVTTMTFFNITIQNRAQRHLVHVFRTEF